MTLALLSQLGAVASCGLAHHAYRSRWPLVFSAQAMARAP